MRLVSYNVKRVDGTIFNTTNYAEATANNNHIIKTCLTELDDRTKEERENAEKLREKRIKCRRNKKAH